MKIRSLIPLTLLGILFLSACSSEPAAPPAPLIERNPEVRKYIDVLTELVDEYCTLVEKTIEQAAEMDKNAEGDDLSSFLNGMDMLSGVATSLIKIKNLSGEINAMEAKKAEFQKNLSPEDFKEFLALYTNTLTRFYELAKKAEELDK
ncbi:MAG: hypothetical protein A3D92_04390 [Bacteroidetes bacterium RIFCSPHIGHO2_02_FULL_44_7]|nr:MAG: hypothetical protein A3D92_04390 [Bacteroidetes bacterium RIFCSPHIGHO2_02_FULL_44_7]